MSLSAAETEIVNSLDGALRPLALLHRQAVLDAGIPFTFISGWRSYDYQALLHSDPTRVSAAPGDSKHEIGMAYDGSGPRNATEWAIYGDLAERLGLVWGGRFKPRADNQHVEFAGTRADLATYRAVLAAAGIAAAVAVVSLIRKR